MLPPAAHRQPSKRLGLDRIFQAGSLGWGAPSQMVSNDFQAQASRTNYNNKTTKYYFPTK